MKFYEVGFKLCAAVEERDALDTAENRKTQAVKLKALILRMAG